MYDFWPNLISVSHSSLLCKMGWYPLWGIVININRINGKECPLLEAHQLELQEEAVRSHPSLRRATSLPRALSPGSQEGAAVGREEEEVPEFQVEDGLPRCGRHWPCGRSEDGPGALGSNTQTWGRRHRKEDREGREGKKEHSSGERNLLSYLTTICLGPKKLMNTSIK